MHLWLYLRSEDTPGSTRIISTINFRMVEMNFGSGDKNFGATKDNYTDVIGSNLATSGTEVRVSTIKFHIHHPKVDNGDGPQVNLRVY